ncbi:MAG: ABC transporter substrate-binding protein, partial [Desulfobacterales bacterium]
MKKSKFVLYSMLAILTLVVLALIRFLLPGTPTPDVQPAGSADLSTHPVYAKYDMRNADDVIHIGTQPLYWPTGLITEAMKRDNILNAAIAARGMKIRYYPFLKGADVNYFLKRDDLDIGIGGDMPALSAAATMNVVIPVLMQQGFISIVARQPMLISDLRGERIGYAFGSNAHYALLNALSSFGISEADVHLVPMEVHEMADALSQGTIDAFSAWEPTPAIALERYPEMVTIHQKLTMGYLYFQQSFMDRHHEVAMEIIAAVARSIRWIQYDRENLLLSCEWTRESSRRLTGQLIPLSTADMADLGLNDLLGIHADPFIPSDSLREEGMLYRELEFLKTLSIIPATSDWK